VQLTVAKEPEVVVVAHVAAALHPKFVEDCCQCQVNVPPVLVGYPLVVVSDPVQVVDCETSMPPLAGLAVGAATVGSLYTVKLTVAV
jgi:hypothetical protein